MSTELHKYGIEEEASDIRAHVGVVTHRVYVFKTANVLDLVRTKSYKQAPAYQAGVEHPTAQGYLVPVNDIPDLRIVHWESVKWWEQFNRQASTTERGRLAVSVVQRLMAMGRFPLWVTGDEVKDIRIDIEGTDIIVAGKWRIQVKCDWYAGSKEHGGSGNVYIQTHECNPLKRH